MFIVVAAIAGFSGWNLYKTITKATSTGWNTAVIFSLVLSIVSFLVCYQIGFILVGALSRGKKFADTDKQYNYAVLIAARNEETVIAQCIQSIKAQDYPSDKITTIVIAHNCTDKTAEVARAAGAVVFECQTKERRKGYALKYAMECLARDYEKGIKHFDGYFIVDADNLLKPN
jgi:cellulose synthase/poly-beta-1,6-N-acetylglucosamine synthase-like glycosyltransferase